MVGQEGGARQATSDTATHIDDSGAVPASKLLHVTHHEELKEHCDNQLKQPATMHKSHAHSQLKQRETTDKSLVYKKPKQPATIHTVNHVRC